MTTFLISHPRCRSSATLWITATQKDSYCGWSARSSVDSSFDLSHCPPLHFLLLTAAVARSSTKVG